MEKDFFTNHYINYAKFLQNLLLENNIQCYLIGGSLINAVRDNGVLKSDDIDFAVIANENYPDLNSILDLISKCSPIFSWHLNVAVLSIYFNLDIKKRIDLNLFMKRNVNYYLADLNFIHEKIFHFQTFKSTQVVLENKNFTTIYRPDLFLKTVYGDYSVEKSQYGSQESGSTLHMKECVLYTSKDNYDKIDIQVENLKYFFSNVIVKREILNVDNKKINIFDDCYSDVITKNENIFYSDFVKFMIKNDIDCLKF
jgi:phosphorylcholine metabolism protein LicD